MKDKIIYTEYLDCGKFGLMPDYSTSGVGEAKSMFIDHDNVFVDVWGGLTTPMGYCAASAKDYKYTPFGDDLDGAMRHAFGS